MQLVWSVTGSVCGLSSAPLGPMNLWIANLPRKKEGRAPLAGIILVDMVYAGGQLMDKVSACSTGSLGSYSILAREPFYCFSE